MKLTALFLHVEGDGPEIQAALDSIPGLLADFGVKPGEVVEKRKPGRPRKTDSWPVIRQPRQSRFQSTEPANQAEEKEL